MDTDARGNVDTRDNPKGRRPGKDLGDRVEIAYWDRVLTLHGPAEYIRRRAEDLDPDWDAEPTDAAYDTGDSIGLLPHEKG